MLEAGLKLLDKLPEGTEWLRAELALRGVEYIVAFVLYGNAALELERVIKRMCEIGEAAQVLPGLINLSILYITRGEPARALELSTRCLGIAEATQDAALLADACWAVGFQASTSGKLREAVSSFEGGMRVLDRTNRRVSPRGILYRSGFAGGLAAASQLLGRVGEAARLADESLKRPFFRILQKGRVCPIAPRTRLPRSAFREKPEANSSIAAWLSPEA
jgi:hypothetical protein